MKAIAKGSSSAIRDSIRAQAERCMYVESVDAQLQDAKKAPCDSFRKLQWLQRKQQQQTISSRIHYAQQKREQEERAAREEAQRTEQQQQLALELQQAADAMARRQAERRQRELDAALARKVGNRRDASVPLAFEEFLEEIVASDVDVRCSSAPLDVKAFDQLGAISIPCKREGNSLTLCRWLQHSGGDDNDSDEPEGDVCLREQLVVFGGRLLQDVTMLLPAAVLKDPMKLERVRYTYSNGVYAYDIATCVWRFRECSGSASAPRERSDHSAVFVEPHFLVIFGGRGRNGQIFKDLFALDLIKWQWREIDTDTKIVERYWHAGCTNDESVFVFGGKSEVIAHGDLQMLSAFSLRELLLLDDDESASSSSTKRKKTKLKPKLAWVCPHTVGNAPSPRFGMALLALDFERIAVVGGCKPCKRKLKKHALQPEPRLMDFYILDTATMIWSTPRLSSHVSILTTPVERMLFECFYQQSTLVVFGGFTYATNGETESFTPRDDSHAVYKLDANRMIWRRQSLAPLGGAESDRSVWLPAPHVHASSNAVLGDRGFTCTVSESHTLLELATFEIRAKASSP